MIQKYPSLEFQIVAVINFKTVVTHREYYRVTVVWINPCQNTNNCTTSIFINAGVAERDTGWILIEIINSDSEALVNSQTICIRTGDNKSDSLIRFMIEALASFEFQVVATIHLKTVVADR